MSDALKIAVLGVVLAIAAAAFWWFGRDAGGDDLGGARVEATEDDAAPAEIVIPRRVSDRPAPVPDLRDEEMPPELRDAAAASVDHGGTEATITIKLVGPDDQPWPERDGDLKLECQTDDERQVEHLTVPVVDGIARFTLSESIQAARPESMRVGEDRRLARNPRGRSFERIELLGGRGEANLRLVPRVDLHVLAREDRRELRRVRILRPRAWGGDIEHPGSFENMRLVAEGDSPLAIDVEEHGTHATYWVAAEGRAATPVHFDKASEGERIVLAGPGGRLAITIAGRSDGIPSDLRPKLRLRDQQAEHHHELTFELDWDGRSTIEIDHLPTGSFVLSLESGELWANPLVVARAGVEIVERATTNVRLEPDLAPLRVTLASVSGQVIVPEAGVANSYLAIQVRPATRREGHPTAHAQVGTTIDRDRPTVRVFSDLKLLPDSYVASIDDQEFPFEVPEGGRSDLVFRLQAKEIVELTLRMEGDDEPVVGAHINWYADGRNGDGSWSPRRKAYLLSPPEGRLSFMIWVGDYFQQAEIDRAPGQGRIELVLKRPQSFELVLKCGDLVIPHSFELPLVIETDDGKPVSIRSAHSDGDSIVRNLDAPGRFRLNLKEAPAGYRAKGPVVFEVKPGETRRVVLELVEDR